MASPVRLSPEFIERVEEATERTMRSLPKQVEYWAQLGEVVERYLKGHEIEALFSGKVEIHVSPKDFESLSMDQVFGELELDRQNKVLGQKVIKAKTWYEASHEHSGELMRVHADGRRERGSIVSGEFKPYKSNATPARRPKDR